MKELLYVTGGTKSSHFALSYVTFLSRNMNIMHGVMWGVGVGGVYELNIQYFMMASRDAVSFEQRKLDYDYEPLPI